MTEEGNVLTQFCKLNNALLERVAELADYNISPDVMQVIAIEDTQVTNSDFSQLQTALQTALTNGNRVIIGLEKKILKQPYFFSKFICKANGSGFQSEEADYNEGYILHMLQNSYSEIGIFKEAEKYRLLIGGLYSKSYTIEQIAEKILKYITFLKNNYERVTFERCLIKPESETSAAAATVEAAIRQILERTQEGGKKKVTKWVSSGKTAVDKSGVKRTLYHNPTKKGEFIKTFVTINGAKKAHFVRFKATKS